jgi:methionine-rich copper-binding protein CopC
MVARILFNREVFVMTQHLLTAALLLSLAGPLTGHAILIDASPAANATVTGPKINIHLKFNSRIDGRRSLIRVVLPDHSAKSLGIDAQVTSDILTASAQGLQTGLYTLQWQVLSTDGHITRGEFQFQIR